MFPPNHPAQRIRGHLNTGTAFANSISFIMPMLTAGIIIIGDDIIKGQVQDTNSNFICKHLHKYGIKVCKIVVIHDDCSDIAEAVKQFSSTYSIVFTSGGTGPTHNGVTYTGVAKAFEEPLVFNEYLEKLLRNIGSRHDINLKPALTMANIPQSSQIIYLQRNKSSLTSNLSEIPIIHVSNVYILPGNPSLFEYAVSSLKPSTLGLNSYDIFFYTHELYLNEDEVVLEECCDKYDSSGIFLSFNGGKDCTVLLHLVCAVFLRKYPGQHKPINTVYIQYEEPFPEVETFIQETVKRYELNLVTIPGPIKGALQKLLREKPHLKAVLMGTRRTDPYSECLKHFQMTDAGWPQLMRVSPMLDWSYHDVWLFLRELLVPYCSLYDKGYTSLGSQHNTRPNQALKFTASNGEQCYHPAYMLKDEDAERNGRH
uniref:FAD synthase n=1 Tax=Timema cristinae TaxID=61476 RepID=A0A7R9C992_TIMCR|nr:unnamed protein product [Timema cristinae]